MDIRKSAVFNAFHCIASQCPDSCCHQWEVEIDEDSKALYASLPGALGQALREAMVCEDGCAFFKSVDDRCPMWREDGLCRIHAELGEEALCNTCRQFPRLTHDFGIFQEWGLELSCPEAARMMLNFDWQEDNTTLPGGEPGDYDEGDMRLFLESREAALEVTRRYPPAQALAILLLYGYHMQAQLDGVELGVFDSSKALDTAVTFRGKGSREALAEFLSGLEILTDQWQQRLAAPFSSGFDPRTGRLCRYFLERYWLQSISDGDLAARVKFAVTGCIIVNMLGGDFVATAQLFSKEIENCAENMDVFLDGAYDEPAMTDDKLLGLLAENF